VAESDGQEQQKPTSVANDESKRWRNGKGEQARIEERVNAAYSYILEGGTRRQIAERIASRFNCSVRTAHDDYSKAMVLLREEQSATREDLLNQIQALRLATVTKALRKGQLQTVAMLLKDMGAVINETGVEQQAAAAPQLSITIDDRRNTSPTE
jgi:hypothetical protein